MEWLNNNNVFVAVILAVVIAQGSKILIHLVKEKRGIVLTDFIVTGSMPSTHSAAVSSLFGILLFTQGLGGLTILALVLFIIVVTDSMGVRRTAGEEAKMINKIIKLEKLKVNPMHYALGHKPIEVFVGICIGFFVSIAVHFLI